MWRDNQYDAIVVGAGPNGLAAAITLIRKKHSVLLIEAEETLGGGTRTKELTLPDFHHDVCSAIHPLALASPFFRSIDLSTYGLRWIEPPIPLAHPLDGENAVLLERSVDVTADGLGEDANNYRRLIGPCVRNWEYPVQELLKPLSAPRHPFVLMKFGLLAMRSAIALARDRFGNKRARALFAGNAAHSIQPLDRWSSAAFGLMLPTLGHAVGWPIAEGGSQAIATALASFFKSMGGTIQLETTISSIDDLPKTGAVLFDVTPRQLARLAGHQFSRAYRKKLENHNHGPGVFKVDWALKAPVPWKRRGVFKSRHASYRWDSGRDCHSGG